MFLLFIFIRQSVFDNAVGFIYRRARLCIVSVDGELVIRDVDDRVGRAPGLIARCDVILLLRDEVVEFGAAGRVGGHVEDAFRVDQGALLHVGDGVAEVLRFVELFVLRIIFELGIEQIVVLTLLAGNFHFIKIVVFTCFARQLISAGIGVVVTLEHYVDLVGIVDRGELVAQDDAVGVGMVEAGAVDILVHYDDAPFRIRMSGDGFFNQGFVVSGIVVVGINMNEQSVAVSVVVAMACGCRVGFFREGVRRVEVILIACRQAVMVADARSFGQAAQSRSGEIAGVLVFLYLQLGGICIVADFACRFVDLVAGGYEEVDFRVLRQCAVERLVPVIRIVSSCYIAVLLGIAFSRSLAGRCADLRVAYVHEREVIRIARLVLLSVLPFAVELYLVVIRFVRFKAVSRYFIRIVLNAADHRAVLAGAGEFFSVLHLFIVSDAHNCRIRFFLGIPAEVQFGKISAGSERYLFVIRLYLVPVGFPLCPVSVVRNGRLGRYLRCQRSVVPVLCRCINGQ